MVRLHHSAHTHKMASTKSFQFLDFPPEIRVLVYRQITVETRHYKIQPRGLYSDSHCTLVVKHLDMSILATCRLIHDECEPVLRALFPSVRKNGVYHIVNLRGFRRYVNYGGMMNPMLSLERTAKSQVSDLSIKELWDNLPSHGEAYSRKTEVAVSTFIVKSVEVLMKRNLLRLMVVTSPEPIDWPATVCAYSRKHRAPTAYSISSSSDRSNTIHRPS